MISIKGQKFLGTDLELIKFIQEDLTNKFDLEVTEYLTKKETAIRVGELIKIYLQKEYQDFKTLNVILNSKDINLLEQKQIIINNDSIKKSASRISLLNKAKELKTYTHLLQLLQEYYKSKEYTTLMDLSFISINSHILIFFFEDNYYTCINTDNEEVFIKYLISSKNFEDYSIDFDDTSSKKLSSAELRLLIEKERVWKNIYAEINNQSKEKVAMRFQLDVFSEKNIMILERNKNYKELYRLAINNI